MTDLIDIGESSAEPVGRRDEDFYPTPREVVEAIIPHLPFGHRVLDLGCGDGAILDVFAGLGCETYGIELDEERAEKARSKGHKILVADLVDIDPALMPTIVSWIEAAHLLPQNAPFVFAEQFTRLTLRHKSPRATFAGLLRISFGDTIDRIAFHREYPEIDTYTIPNRIDFTRGALRTCPKCKGTGKQAEFVQRGPRSKIDPYRCEKCGGRGYLKGGNDSAAVAWWVAGPGRAGRRFVLDEVRVPPLVQEVAAE